MGSLVLSRRAIVLFVLWLAVPAQAQAAITYFGSASSTADGGLSTTSPAAVTPPASMQTGDLVLLTGVYRGATTMDMSELGGQTWTEAFTIGSASLVTETYWACFDGTWDAEPSISSSSTTNSFTAVMHVFRSSSTCMEVDVAGAAADYSTPSSPFDVTVPAITTQTNGALVFVVYSSFDDNQWTVQTGAYVHAGGNQYRNLGGADSSSSYVYDVQASAGTTGDIVNQQTSLGGDAGSYGIIAFKEAGGAATPGCKNGLMLLGVGC